MSIAVAATTGALQSKSHLVRLFLWIQRTGAPLWSLSLLRNEKCQNEATQRLTSGWHEHLQRCGMSPLWLTRTLTTYHTWLQILCLITGPVSLVIDDQVNSHFAFIGLTIIFCCILSMALIFIPKILEIVQHQQNLSK